MPCDLSLTYDVLFLIPWSLLCILRPGIVDFAPYAYTHVSTMSQLELNVLRDLHLLNLRRKPRPETETKLALCISVLHVALKVTTVYFG